MTHFVISTNKADLDVEMIYKFLSEQSTWAVGIPRRVVDRALENSLCFGGYLDGKQIAFARVVTDFSTFANLVDVFVLPPYRGHGFAKEIMKSVIGHASLHNGEIATVKGLQGLRGYPF